MASDDPKYSNLLARQTGIKTILYFCSWSANLPRFGVSWHPAWGKLAPRSNISHLKHLMDDKYILNVTEVYWLMSLLNLTYSCHKYNAFHLLKFLYTQNGTNFHNPCILSIILLVCCWNMLPYTPNNLKTKQNNFSSIWLEFNFKTPFCFFVTFSGWSFLSATSSLFSHFYNSFTWTFLLQRLFFRSVS